MDATSISATARTTPQHRAQAAKEENAMTWTGHCGRRNNDATQFVDSTVAQDNDDQSARPVDHHTLRRAMRQPSLRSCLKVTATHELDDSSATTPLASSFPCQRAVKPTVSPTRPKSVHISEHLPRRNDGLQRASSCRSLSQARSSHHRHLVSTKHRRITSEAIPASTSTLETSPTLSCSTSGSEADQGALDTPVDEQHTLSYASDMSSSDLVSEYCADSEHSHRPSSDSLSDPAISLDRLSLAWQAEAEPTMTTRRAALRTLPLLDRRSAALNLAASNSLNTKTDVCGVTGISRAVSKGLEMGLGLSMTPAVVAGSFAADNTASLSPESSRSRASAQNVPELRMTEHALADDPSDLHRRKTTGGLHAASVAVGKKRIHRTGTQDPHGGQAVQNDSRSSSSNTAPSSPAVDYERTFASMSTPFDTPSHEYKATLSPDVGVPSSNDSRIGLRIDDYGRTPTDVRDRSMAPDARIGTVDRNLTGGLMGVGDVGHFGPGVRAMVAGVLKALLDTLPVTFEEGEVVHMTEYGSSKSRSALLFQPVISSLARRSICQDAADKCTSCKITFCVSHQDAPPSDFHSTMQLLDSHPESYMDAHWQARHEPCLQDVIFPSFSVRPFAARLAPPRTMHLGLSLMDMHWTHAPIPTSVNRSAAAQAELTAFLRARANEFKKDGILMMAYIARREQKGSGVGLSSQAADPEVFQAPQNDLWTTLSNVLAPCIQRLVSCGMLKSDVARRLLELPLIPRTAEQTRASLDAVKEDWTLAWSCGLNDECTQSTRLPSEPNPLRLPHPAWKAYESGCLSRVAFTEHVIQLFKTLYEAHFRATLRERGRLSKGAVEFVLDSLWDALFSRIVDQQSAIVVHNVEIEVCVYALRRR